MTDRWTVGSLLKWAKSYLQKHGIASPRLDAEYLIVHALNRCEQDVKSLHRSKLTRIDLYTHFDQPLSETELACFKSLLISRARDRLPVAYITQRRGFWQHDFYVTRDVLVPRPETEHIVQRAIEICRKKVLDQSSISTVYQMVDICTGSGVIAISVAAEIAPSTPQWRFTASDISASALAVAQRNADEILLPQSIDITIENRDLLVGVSPESIDLLTANPPYVTTSELDELALEISHEPRLALHSGEDGLEHVRRIAEQAMSCLVDGGIALVEIGSQQGKAARDLFIAAGFSTVVIGHDFAGHDRYIEATK